MNGHFGTARIPRARTSSSAARASAPPTPRPSSVTVVWRKIRWSRRSLYSATPASSPSTCASYRLRSGASATSGDPFSTRSEYGVAVPVDMFDGWIAGVGTASGLRAVLGHWPRSPLGPFADVMVERADGHRLLLAPTPGVADYVAATYRFDEVRVVPVAVRVDGAWWSVAAGPLDLRFAVAGRPALGVLLRAVPPPSPPGRCVDPRRRRRPRGSARRPHPRQRGRRAAASGTPHATCGASRPRPCGGRGGTRDRWRR